MPILRREIPIAARAPLLPFFGEKMVGKNSCLVAVPLSTIIGIGQY